MMCSNKFYISDEYYYTIKRIKNRIIYIPCDELKAKGQEIKDDDLLKIIQKTIKEKFDIDLHTEVRIIGKEK